MIFHFQLQALGQKSQTHPGFSGAGMPRHIIQSFLHNAINMDSGIAIHGKGCPRFLIGYVNAGLPFHHGQIPVQRAFQAGLVEHDGMQRLRQAAHLIQRGLRDLCHFADRRAKANLPAACFPARPNMEPTAVRICPNSSCNSREIWRSVDS